MRSRRLYFVSTLVGLAFTHVIVAGRGAGGPPTGFGSLFILGLLLAAGPFCRSWLDEDVRLGLAAFWLQKPLRPAEFYLARLLAAVGWSVVAALAVGLAAVPAAAFPASSLDAIARSLFTLGWVPPLLVVMSSLGSVLGARNGALFAYGVLFGGFALPGLREGLGLGAAAEVLEVVLPPTEAAWEARAALGVGGGYLGGVAELAPLLLYTGLCGALAVLLALRIPERLARTE